MKKIMFGDFLKKHKLKITILILVTVLVAGLFVFKSESENNDSKEEKEDVLKEHIIPITVNTAELEGEYEIVDGLYKNKKHNFSIKFPKSWNVEDGDGASNIVKKISNEKGYITIEIDQLELDEEEDEGEDGESEKSERTLSDPSEFIDEYYVDADSFTQRGYGIEIVDSGKEVVNDKKTYWNEYRDSYEFVGETVGMQNIVYTFSKKDSNLICTISATSTIEDYPELKPIFLKAIKSFKFE